jgi:hypothetical protein
MKWFGDHWSAPINTNAPKVDRPTDQVCIRCRFGFLPEHRGVILYNYQRREGLILPGRASESAFHLRCFLEEIGVGFLDYQ